MLNNEPVWIEVNCKGEVSKTAYFGRFSVKPYLTMRERSEVSRLFETYTRGITEDVGQRAVLYALSQLAFHIVETDATWWKEKGLDLVDEEPIVQLLAQLKKVQDPELTAETPKAP